LVAGFSVWECLITNNRWYIRQGCRYKRK